MKLMEKMKQKRLGNKGFSLIELIIVIAIMAVLLGLVGTQVIPYIQRSREAKDLQIVNSFSTAAVTAYSSHAEFFDDLEATNTTIELHVFDNHDITTFNPDLVQATKRELTDLLQGEIYTLTGYDTADKLDTAMTSKKGKTIQEIVITINLGTGVVTTQAYSSLGTVNTANAVFDPVTSYIGSQN